MSDILSNFYQTLYTFNNNREYKNPLTPNKQRKIKNSLSKYIKGKYATFIIIFLK